MRAKEKQLERAAEDLRRDSQTDSQQVFPRVSKQVFSSLQGYAKQHDSSAIIDRGTDAAPIVWYVVENVDITSALVMPYSAKSGKPAPTPGTLKMHQEQLLQARCLIDECVCVSKRHIRHAGASPCQISFGCALNHDRR